MKPCLLLASLLVLSFRAHSTPGDTVITKKVYVTKRIEGTITLDGIPKEPAWDAVEWGGDFIQNQPYEGRPPSQETSFKILYDNHFLYIAYYCHDRSPDSIEKRMSRRDQFPGDWVEINIDSYHDQRTGFSFTLSVSGVRGDEFISNNGNNWDANWNPIWYSKTHMTTDGWTGEVKIPLSQLRYNNDADKVWGIQFTRRLFRKEERSNWQFIPQSSGQWVSGFGELRGLKDIPTHRQVEIAPYITMQADKYKKVPGNPFAKGLDGKVSGGVDGKLAVTNDLILDFTVNPDFGQVEADPSQVRIDGFQNFFSEQRPFFVESRNIFDYQLTGSVVGGDYDADLLFYSRRIGSSPHGSVSLASGEYMKFPQNTSILGATKFSGKTRKGFSIGILESITARELATVDNNGQKRKELVEPLTNFFVTRLQKDFNKGNTIFGGIITAVNREHGLDNILHKSAYSGGLDFLHYWKNRSWYVRGNVIFSQVTGTKEAILRTQTAFEHLYQRVDAKELEVDSARTSLSGVGGTIRFGKQAGKQGKKGQVFKFDSGITLRSPGLELNDIGFMLTANEINQFTWGALQFQKPFWIFRRLNINANEWLRFDCNGKLLLQFYNVNTNANFKNNWQGGAGFSWNPFEISNNALRGASSVRRPIGAGGSVFLNSDFRKKIYFSSNINAFGGSDNTVTSFNAGLTINVQPIDALNISLGSNYSYYWRRMDQFVANRNYNNGIRTIVSKVSQKTLRFTMRINYNITPDLTIQYYGQPFITRPLYSNYGYVTSPLAKDIDDRIVVFDTAQLHFSNGTYVVDENRDGTTDYSFGKPDFNFVQFRSNLVMRWEYRRGSELYLVWSQSNTANAFAELDTPIFQSLFDNAFSGNFRNIFLVKWTYRFLK